MNFRKYSLISIIALSPILFGCTRSSTTDSWEDEPWIILDLGSNVPNFESDSPEDYRGVGGGDHQGRTRVLLDGDVIQDLHAGGVSLILNPFLENGSKTLRVESDGLVEIYFILRYGDRLLEYSTVLEKGVVSPGDSAYEIHLKTVSIAIQEHLKREEDSRLLYRFQHSETLQNIGVY